MKRWTTIAVAVTSLCPLMLTGCQSTVGGQTLPSAYYLEDDVQFFPAGPEFKLTNQVRALEEHQLRRANFSEGLGAVAP